MSIINLISLITLAVVLLVGVSIHLWLKRRLKQLDGVIGIVTGEELMQAIDPDY